MEYRKDCKFLVQRDDGYYCSVNRTVSSACSDECDGYVRRNNVSSLNNSPVEVLERIGQDKTKYEHDKNIRGLLGFTNFTGFLLTRVIKELKGVSLEQFKEGTGGSDLLQIGQTEFTSPSTKNVRLDLVIEYDDYGRLKLRIDTEPQDSQETYSKKTEDSYSLVARAVYYGSVLLATALQPGESYHNLRKVYSVWICFKRPVADMREPILRYNMTPEKEYRYYKKDANGEDSIHSCRHKFDDGDLLSVILISVPDIEIAVKKNQSGSDCDYDHIMLEELYKLLSPEVTMEERKEFFADKNIDSGGECSMDIFQILRKELAEKDEELAKKDEEMAKKDKEMAKKDKTIAALMAELAKLQANPQK